MLTAKATSEGLGGVHRTYIICIAGTAVRISIVSTTFILNPWNEPTIPRCARQGPRKPPLGRAPTNSSIPGWSIHPSMLHTHV